MYSEDEFCNGSVDDIDKWDEELKGSISLCILAEFGEEHTNTVVAAYNKWINNNLGVPAPIEPSKDWEGWNK